LSKKISQFLQCYQQYLNIALLNSWIWTKFAS